VGYGCLLSFAEWLNVLRQWFISCSHHRRHCSTTQLSTCLLTCITSTSVGPRRYPRKPLKGGAFSSSSFSLFGPTRAFHLNPLCLCTSLYHLRIIVLLFPHAIVSFLCSFYSCYPNTIWAVICHHPPLIRGRSNVLVQVVSMIDSDAFTLIRAKTSIPTERMYSPTPRSAPSST